LNHCRRLTQQPKIHSVGLCPPCGFFIPPLENKTFRQSGRSSHPAGRQKTKSLLTSHPGSISFFYFCFFKDDMDIRFLVIEGNIGAGKTSLATMLSREFNAKLVLEQFVDNPFLPKFYADPDKYSFPLELAFLADRYNQIKKEVLNPDLFHSFLVADYYFTKSAIFASNTLQADEYRLFRRLFDIVFESLPKPDLYVYLHAGTEALLQNIRRRGRDYEQNITPEYLETIRRGYFDYFRQVTQFPIAVIETSQIDFVNNPVDYDRIKEVIFQNDFKLGINRIILP